MPLTAMAKSIPPQGKCPADKKPSPPTRLGGSVYRPLSDIFLATWQNAPITLLYPTAALAVSRPLSSTGLSNKWAKSKYGQNTIKSNEYDDSTES
jgi:hypothetical protein